MNDELLCNRPFALVMGRYATPYVNAKRGIDRQVERYFDHVEEKHELGHELGHIRSPTTFGFLQGTSIGVPESIEDSRVRLQKRRYELMIEKVYKDEIPPHRLTVQRDALRDTPNRLISRLEGQESKEKTFDNKQKPRRAELYIDLQWKPPYSSEKNIPYELKRLRWEDDWIAAREQEDKIVLFGDRRQNSKESRKQKLERWKEINQERYFWDFVDRYSEAASDEERKRGLSIATSVVNSEIKKEYSDKNVRYSDKNVRYTTMNDVINEESAKLHCKDKFSYLPSIFPFEPPVYK